MANDKNLEMTGGEGAPDQDFSTDSSTRARNRTVMLTPEITGQVRAMLAQELGHEGQPAPAVSAPPRTKASAGGYMSSPELSSTYQPSAPAGHQSHSSEKGAAMAGGFGHAVEQPRTAPARAAQPAAFQQPVRTTPVVGFLVSFDKDSNGEVYELRTGRWIVSSEQTTAGNFILVNSPSISTLHAIIRVSPAGEIQVLDQLSEFGTGVKKFGNETEDELTGAMASLEHGDVVRFGDRCFNVCVIQKIA